MPMKMMKVGASEEKTQKIKKKKGIQRIERESVSKIENFFNLF